MRFADGYDSRFRVGSSSSSEQYRDEFLVPALKAGDEVVVRMDEVLGYSSAFLRAVFSDLTNLTGLSSRELRQRLTLVTPDAILVREVWMYIEGGEKKPLTEERFLQISSDLDRDNENTKLEQICQVCGVSFVLPEEGWRFDKALEHYVNVHGARVHCIAPREVLWLGSPLSVLTAVLQVSVGLPQRSPWHTGCVCGHARVHHRAAEEEGPDALMFECGYRVSDSSDRCPCQKFAPASAPKVQTGLTQI